MGNQTSLTAEQLEDIKMESNFTDDDLLRLFRRFKKLDTDHSGALSVDEFMAIPELEANPLVRRVIATFDADGNGEVDFKEFIESLAVFSAKGDAAREAKYRFTFALYDVDSDGFISNKDLFLVLTAMVGNNLSQVQLQQLVDRTIMQGDKDKDGKLSFEEFKGMVESTDLHLKLSLDIDMYNQ